MNVFTVPVEVSDLDRQRIERVDAWVDTGAFYSSLPRPLLESMGVTPHDSLLGAYTLEGLALAVDSLNERLVPRAWLPLFEVLPA